MKYLLIILLIMVGCNHKEVKKDKVNHFYNYSSKNFDYYPISKNSVIYHKKGYSFGYVEKYEQSEWVAYVLNSSDWNSNSHFDRPFFQQDPIVKTQSAHWNNYKKSGYTKGHLCPAQDRKSSLQLYNETFLTSNVCPQEYNFNSGVWERLEQKVRYWAAKYKGLYVVTGGVLTEGLKTIGNEKVVVPNYFYKVLLTKDQSKMIAFLVPHKDSDLPLYNFVTNVDEIEKLTKIDFFNKLDDIREIPLEKNKLYKEWSFN